MKLSGKNNRRQLIAYDSIHNVQLSVDSVEEQDFLAWCCEACELSIITDFSYQPDAFKLFDNTKYTDVYGKTRTLFQEHIYTCDFVLKLNPSINLELSKEFKVNYSDLHKSEICIYIDCKGTFNRNARSFSTDRKWVWTNFNIYVCEIVPAKFFQKFGCPKISFYSKKTKKPRKLFQGCKTLNQIFFKSN